MSDPLQTPTVFLSSASDRHVPLRKRIVESRDHLPVFLWAYEYVWSDDLGAKHPSDFLVDRCFSGIKESNLFVFIIGDRHGSGVEYTEDVSFVTYLELELLAAALLQKPILVLQVAGHEPNPALQDCIDFLKRGFADRYYKVANESDLFAFFAAACEELASTGQLSHNSSFIGLPEWLSIHRSDPELEKDLLNPRLRFINDSFPPPRAVCNLPSVKILLDQVASGSIEDASTGALMSHGTALFRLWVALRELMNNAQETTQEPSAAQLWDRLLGLWAGKASWFGLHGHVWMGPLAAINSQIVIRRRFQAEPSFCASLDVREPLGARASAIYSIAQRMQSRRQKMKHYREAASLAAQAVKRDADGQGGALSIHAHALLQMAQLGEVWKLWSAAAEFRCCVELREKSGASAPAVGEAKTDLGFCSILTGHPWRGLRLLREGVDLMRGSGSADGEAFLARGLRKLERGALLVRQRELAEAARQERLTIATRLDALDQARRI